MIFEKIGSQSGVSLLIVEQNAHKSLELSHRGYVLADGQNKLQDGYATFFQILKSFPYLEVNLKIA